MPYDYAAVVREDGDWDIVDGDGVLTTVKAPGYYMETNAPGLILNLVREVLEEVENQEEDSPLLERLEQIETTASRLVSWFRVLQQRQARVPVSWSQWLHDNHPERDDPDRVVECPHCGDHQTMKEALKLTHCPTCGYPPDRDGP